MIRKSTALWRGDALHGTGALTTQSGALREQPYSFKTRFQSEDGKAGTNPEELLAAAHAGCYAMALSFALGNAGHPPAELNVTGVPALEGARRDADHAVGEASLKRTLARSALDSSDRVSAASIRIAGAHPADRGRYGSGRPPCSRRHWPGVAPTTRWNVRVNAAWSPKPEWSATSPSGILVSVRSSLARSIRCSVSH